MTEVTVRPSESAEEDVVAEIEATDAAATTEETAEDDAKPSVKRYTPAEWVEMETHWQCGTMSATDIMRKYGITISALRSHFARYKIRQNSHRHILKKEAEIKIMGAAGAALDPKQIAYEDARKSRILQTRETANNHLTVITAMSNILLREISDKTRTAAQCANDFKSLRHAELLTERTAFARLRILQADDDVDESKLPTLVFRDLSEEELARIANADKEDEFDLDMPDLPIDLMDEEIVEEGLPATTPKVEE